MAHVRQHANCGGEFVIKAAIPRAVRDFTYRNAPHDEEVQAFADFFGLETPRSQLKKFRESLELKERRLAEHAEDVELLEREAQNIRDKIAAIASFSGE